MTDTISGVIPFDHSDRDGSGLVEWEALDPANLDSGEPIQRGKIYDEDQSSGYMSGLWDCTAFVDRPGPYAVDEFMFLLEGTVVMGLPDGTEVTINAGEAFVLPKGLDCHWKMPGYVRKVFMIVDDPILEGATNPSLSRVTKPDLSLVSSSSENSVDLTDEIFRNSAGTMTVSITVSSGGRSANETPVVHELLHVLSGTYSVSDAKGTHSFGPGDTFYLPRGTSLDRELSPGTRYLTAKHAPKMS